MSAHKEAAKQRKRKSLKMALEKCMQRRDAMAAVPEAVGGGEETAAAEAEMEAPVQASGAHTTIHTSGSAGTEPFSYEQQQQKMHHELAQQIKAAMAVEQAQRAEAEAEAEAMMDTTVNTTHTTTTTNTTNTTTGTSDGGSGSDAEASDGSLERTMEVDESVPEPQPGSELVVVEPKIEPLSDTEDEEEQTDHHHLHMSEPEPELEPEPEVYNRMPHTPTSPPAHIIPPNETPTLTSTPKVNVEQ